MRNIGDTTVFQPVCQECYTGRTEGEIKPDSRHGSLLSFRRKN